MDKIYSYGFSYGEVDLIYIKEICKRMDTSDTIWYLNDFDNEKIKEYKKIIKGCGSRGKITTFYTD
ncbi:hypothetical protein [Leptotrichia wadei]|uniref:hypothetical protein n=1 Tax=Leptotrichia wadei TaxID=157687 RepID=UPI0038B40566